MEGVKGKYLESFSSVTDIPEYVSAAGLLFPAVRTCFVNDLQRGLKIQEAKFNLDGTAEVSELFVYCLPHLSKHFCWEMYAYNETLFF